MKQQSFFAKVPKRLIHGGKVRAGKGKLFRPLCTKNWLHLCLKSRFPKGHLSLLRKEYLIQDLLHETAKQCFVEIGDFVIMRDHIHIQARLRDLSFFRNFLRVFAGKCARLMTGATKGKPFGAFWAHCAWTRILTTPFELLILKNYFKGNRVEKEQGYEAREEHLRQTRELYYDMRYDKSD
jgi:REP element-mobilizing transposase RayT